ncbi:Cytospin-B [Myotis brandtii]|uniref:Cytospin-B n=1 Tax=Myotis brandtii TaxID=109478 RepID=S7PHK6_MYOBR|nr:Cytospin-B [Myotis brandtii]
MVLFTPNRIIFFDTVGKIMLQPVKDTHRCVELCICPLRTAVLCKGPSLHRNLWAVGLPTGFLLKRASSEDMLNKPGSATASAVVRLKKTSTAGTISELTESRLRSHPGRRNAGQERMSEGPGQEGPRSEGPSRPLILAQDSTSVTDASLPASDMCGALTLGQELL